eukprot:34083_1
MATPAASTVTSLTSTTTLTPSTAPTPAPTWTPTLAPLVMWKNLQCKSAAVQRNKKTESTMTCWTTPGLSNLYISRPQVFQIGLHCNVNDVIQFTSSLSSSKQPWLESCGSDQTIHKTISDGIFDSEFQINTISSFPVSIYMAQFSYYPVAYDKEPCTRQTICASPAIQSKNSLSCLPIPSTTLAKYMQSTCRHSLPSILHPIPKPSNCNTTELPDGLRLVDASSPMACNEIHVFEVEKTGHFITDISIPSHSNRLGEITMIQLKFVDNAWIFPGNEYRSWDAKYITKCPIEYSICIANECNSDGVQYLQFTATDGDYVTCSSPYILNRLESEITCHHECDVDVGWILGLLFGGIMLSILQVLLCYLLAITYVKMKYNRGIDFETAFWQHRVKEKVQTILKQRNPHKDVTVSESETSSDVDLHHNYNFGDRVEVKISRKQYKWGTIEYIGKLEHLSRRGKDERIYFGVELDEEYGDNNGSIGRIEYFDCPDHYGVFVVENDIKTWIRQRPKAFVGDTVQINECGAGKVRWIGNLSYLTHRRQAYVLCYGVELMQPKGKHNGIYAGKRYFECDTKCGIFCKGIDILSTKASQCKYKVGDTVKVKQYGTGIIQFIGDIDEYPGWIKYGIKLRDKKGQNDGTINGKRYFKCKAKYGVFVRKDRIKAIVRKCKLKYRINDCVELEDYGVGIIKYIGTTPEVPDDVVFGVDLEKSKGKNNGKVNGRRYFDTDKGHGVFVTKQYIIHKIEHHADGSQSYSDHSA